MKPRACGYGCSEILCNYCLRQQVQVSQRLLTTHEALENAQPLLQRRAGLWRRGGETEKRHASRVIHLCTGSSLPSRGLAGPSRGPPTRRRSGDLQCSVRLSSVQCSCAEFSVVIASVHTPGGLAGGGASAGSGTGAAARPGRPARDAVTPPVTPQQRRRRAVSAGVCGRN